MKIYKIQATTMHPHSVLDWIRMNGDNGYPINQLCHHDLAEARKLENNGFILKKKTPDGLAYVINPVKFHQMGWSTTDLAGQMHPPPFTDNDAPTGLNLQERFGWLDGANGEKVNPPDDLYRTTEDGKQDATNVRAQDYLRGYGIGAEHARRNPKQAS